MSRSRPNWRSDYAPYPPPFGAGTKRPRSPGGPRGYDYDYGYYPPGPGPANRTRYAPPPPPRVGDGWYDYAYPRDHPPGPPSVSPRWYRDEWDAYYDAQHRRARWEEYDRLREFWDYPPPQHPPLSAGLPPPPPPVPASVPRASNSRPSSRASPRVPPSSSASASASLPPPPLGPNAPSKGDTNLRARLHPHSSAATAALSATSGPTAANVSVAAHPISGADASASPLSTDPYQDDTLMTFKAFAQWYRSSRAGVATSERRLSDEAATSGDEVWNEYQNYRSIVLKRQLCKFFQSHRDQAWFRERYSLDPVSVHRRKQHKYLGRDGRKSRWLAELAEGKLDALTWDVKPVVATPPPDSTGPDSEYSAARRLPPRPGAGPQTFRATSRLGLSRELTGNEKVESILPQLLLTNVMPDTDRSELEALLIRLAGDQFLYLAMGEPRETKKWSRNGFAVFAQGTPVDDVATQINQSTLNGMQLSSRRPDRDISVRVHVRIMPPHAGSRLKHDLVQTQKLVAMFETEDRSDIFVPAVLSSLLLERRRAKGRESQQDDATATAEEEASAKETLAAAREWLDESVSNTVAARCQEQFGFSLDEVLDAFEVDPFATQQEEGNDAPASESVSDANDLMARQRTLEPALKRALDWHIDALREIWHMDYYSGLVRDFEEELVRREPIVARRFLPDDGASAGSESAQRAFKILDGKIAQLLNPGEVNLTELGGKSVEKELESLLAPFIKEEEAERHRCMVPIESDEPKVCGKLFRAAVFVQKHFYNKHRTWYETLTDPTIEQANYFNQYVLDPNRPVSISSTPASASRPATEETYEDDGPAPKRAKHASAPLAARLGGRAEARTHSHPVPERGPRRPLPEREAMSPSEMPPPRSLDPRASRGTTRSYQDLDDAPPAAGGVFDLLY